MWGRVRAAPRQEAFERAFEREREREREDERERGEKVRKCPMGI